MKIIGNTIFICSLVTFVFCDYIDTGYIIWNQPDSTQFTARLWGDEFISHMRTQDDYTIIYNSQDYYYYYAILDGSGEFSSSSNKVGIDSPLNESLNLERSQVRISEIEQEITAFNQQVEANEVEYNSRMINRNATYSFGIVLVDFVNPDPLDNDGYYRQTTVDYPNGYNRGFYQDMMFSIDSWIGQTPPTPHPEDHIVFGSFIDYYTQQSNGHTIINGSLVNGNSANDPALPEWIVLPLSKEEYQYEQQLFIDHLNQEASSMGLPLAYDKLGIIFAGEAIYTQGNIFWPHANSVNGEFYMAPEVKSGTFGHIGVHCHEFGHLIGAKDEYMGNIDPESWCIMARGSKNGPLWKGECPAGFSPYYRIKKNWVEPTIITENVSAFEVSYDYENPIYYMLYSPYDETEYFVIENRLRDGFDAWTPPTFDVNPIYNDPNGAAGGLLVWHNYVNYNGSNNSSDDVELEASDGVNDIFSLNSDPFPHDGNSGQFNSSSDPNSFWRDGSISGFEVNNIAWNTETQSTTIDVTVPFPFTFIEENTTWTGSITVDKTTFVKENVTLTISGGTDITVLPSQSDYLIEIMFFQGSHLELQGTTENPITFHSVNPEGQRGLWKGIYFRSNDIVQISTIENLVVMDSDYGLHFAGHPDESTEIKSCKFENNNRSFVLGPSYSNTSWKITDCQFINSPFDTFIDENLTDATSNLNITRNLFQSNMNSININPGNIGNTINIINNTIVDNTNGIIIGEESSPAALRVVNNIISNNDYGLNIIEPYNNTHDINYNVFWGNTTDGHIGEDYINADPLLDSDKTLMWNSPCINTGNPDTNDNGIEWYGFDQDPNTSDDDIQDQDLDGSRFDIGANPTEFWLDRGDVNLDGEVDVADNTELVCIILEEPGCEDPGHDKQIRGDVARDGTLNVVDVVQLVGCIVENDCPDGLNRSNPNSFAELLITTSTELSRWEGDVFVLTTNSNVPILGSINI